MPSNKKKPLFNSSIQCNVCGTVFGLRSVEYVTYKHCGIPIDEWCCPKCESTDLHIMKHIGCNDTIYNSSFNN